jgi:short-subunit dehydrogenase
MTTETALITGASSGIGLHLAHECARRGHPIVITAPVESELQRIGEKFKTDYNVYSTRDRHRPRITERCAANLDELESANVEVDIMVNNAGHGFHGKWWEAADRKGSLNAATEC